MVTSFATTRGTNFGLGSRTFFAAALLVTLSSFAKETATVLLEIPRGVSSVMSSLAVVHAASLPLAYSAPIPAPTVSLPAPLAIATPAPSPVRTHAAHSKPLAGLFTGMASWYGKILQDHRTASGRRFNMFELTAAHRSLPFGSKVRVTNLRNRRSVIVTITDRGVLNADRIIDLSYAAAEQLDMIRSGVDPVRLDVLTKKEALLAEAAIPAQP